MGQRIVLIGAGSAMFGLGALGDIFKSRALAGSTVVLYDINTEAVRKVESIVRNYLAGVELDYAVTVAFSLEEALDGADFCIISIEVGDRYKLWEQDWHIPQQFGINQVYGENGGPGGIFHALRIIPPIMEICEQICRYCPECLVFNLSNPLTTINMAIHVRYPQLRVVGVCHEIAAIIEHLPKLLNRPFAELQTVSGGLNHFSILLEARYADSGMDAYPDIRRWATEYYCCLPEHGLFVEFFRIYGYLPVTTDSHFSEYIHWAQGVADHKGVFDFYRNYKRCCLQQQDRARRLRTGTAPQEYWRVIPIIEGIVTNSGHEELAVNVPNNGLIPALPGDVVVEVPARVDRQGVHPQSIGELPPGFAALLTNRVGCITLTVEAALTASKNLALQALLAEPTVNSLSAAEKTFAVIYNYQQEYLGYLK